MANAYRSVLQDAKPTGNALPADVLAEKTFSNADGIDKTGTMVNNGAVTITLTAQDPSYTVPEGYHNGSGTVSFTPSGGDGADLVVTCSEDFAGATISCTDGTITFTEICPSTSPYVVTFESIPTGTWTISATVYGLTFSTIVTILDFSAALNAIPEGSSVTPTDDVQTWLHCGGIWDKSYTTVSQVLSDSTTLLALISDNNAVDYMVRSTTWANDVCADSTAMTYIGANDYCAETLLANTIWATAICNSTYFESVLNVKVPTMTSNTTPSGVVSGNVSTQYYAFDNNDSTQTQSNTENSNPYVSYEFTKAISVKKARVYGQGSGKNFSCSIQYLNSSNNWVDLQTVSITTSGTDQTFVFPNNTAKSASYRIFSSTQKTSGNNLFYKTVQFYGR